MRRVRLNAPISAQELADRLGVKLLTIYRWRASHKLPAVEMRNEAKPAQKYMFAPDEVEKWLRRRRPELLFAWNGEDAPITRPNSWTRRRLANAMTKMAA